MNSVGTQSDHEEIVADDNVLQLEGFPVRHGTWPEPDEREVGEHEHQRLHGAPHQRPVSHSRVWGRKLTMYPVVRSTMYMMLRKGLSWGAWGL